MRIQIAKQTCYVRQDESGNYLQTVYWKSSDKKMTLKMSKRIEEKDYADFLIRKIEYLHLKEDTNLQVEHESVPIVIDYNAILKFE